MRHYYSFITISCSSFIYCSLMYYSILGGVDLVLCCYGKGNLVGVRLSAFWALYNVATMLMPCCVRSHDCRLAMHTTVFILHNVHILLYNMIELLPQDYTLNHVQVVCHQAVFQATSCDMLQCVIFPHRSTLPPLLLTMQPPLSLFQMQPLQSLTCKPLPPSHTCPPVCVPVCFRITPQGAWKKMCTSVPCSYGSSSQSLDPHL